MSYAATGRIQASRSYINLHNIKNLPRRGFPRLPATVSFLYLVTSLRVWSGTLANLCAVSNSLIMPSRALWRRLDTMSMHGKRRARGGEGRGGEEEQEGREVVLMFAVHPDVRRVQQSKYVPEQAMP